MTEISQDLPVTAIAADVANPSSSIPVSILLTALCMLLRARAGDGPPSVHRPQSRAFSRSVKKVERLLLTETTKDLLKTLQEYIQKKDKLTGFPQRLNNDVSAGRAEHLLALIRSLSPECKEALNELRHCLETGIRSQKYS